MRAIVEIKLPNDSKLYFISEEFDGIGYETEGAIHMCITDLVTKIDGNIQCKNSRPIDVRKELLVSIENITEKFKL